MVRCPVCLEEMQYQNASWRSSTPRVGGYYSHVLDIAMMWPDTDSDLTVDICPINHVAWWASQVSDVEATWAYLETTFDTWIGSARVTDILGLTFPAEE